MPKIGDSPSQERNFPFHSLLTQNHCLVNTILKTESTSIAFLQAFWRQEAYLKYE